ncbi:MAG: CDP-2,3-bis-(O-geranylgeranyl)-sn-glycerol synthase [Thermoproteota archaeon]
MLAQEVFELGIIGVLYYVPAYVANASALIFKGKRRIDFEKTFIDGKPILGEGKTIEGFTLGLATGMLVGVLTGLPVLTSLLTAFGALLGDLAGAFIKRRFSINPGDPAPVLDQFDFMLGATIISKSWENLDPRSIIIAVALTPAMHIVSNYVAFLLKIKRVPW